MKNCDAEVYNVSLAPIMLINVKKHIDEAKLERLAKLAHRTIAFVGSKET